MKGYVIGFILGVVITTLSAILILYTGLGSTAIACKIHERNFIGFEIDKEYYTNTLKRIEQYKVQGSLF